MEAMAALSPKFFRLPGGNNMEGNTNKTFWMWNNTIGPLKERPGYDGTWGYEQTAGLGLVEYLLWAQDLAAEPSKSKYLNGQWIIANRWAVLAVWDGLALNGDVTPEDKIGIFVQDALNELEFLMGDKSTHYGALRTSYGYPDPWNIKYVEVGNEDWLAGAPEGWESYKQYRFTAFLDAIAAKYPDIFVLASGSVFDNMTIPAPAGGDYHDYQTPDGFVEQFDQFDQLTIHNQTLLGKLSYSQV